MSEEVCLEQSGSTWIGSINVYGDIFTFTLSCQSSGYRIIISNEQTVYAGSGNCTDGINFGPISIGGVLFDAKLTDINCCGSSSSSSSSSSSIKDSFCETCGATRCAFPEAWTFSVEGIINEHCTGCDILNGDFTIHHTDTCTWESDSLGALCSVPVNWSLFYDIPTDTWHLSQGNNDGFWEINAADFDCCGTNVLDFVSAGLEVNDCTNYPSTITINPVGTCPKVCPTCCTNSLPQTLHAFFENTGDCFDCIGPGFTVELNYDPNTNEWIGFTTFCGHSVTVTFYCSDGGTTCNNFELRVFFTDFCDGSSTIPTISGECSCDPLDVVFNCALGSLSTCGCEDPTNATFNVTITE